MSVHAAWPSGLKDCALRAWDGVGRAENVTIYT